MFDKGKGRKKLLYNKVFLSLLFFACCAFVLTWGDAHKVLFFFIGERKWSVVWGLFRIFVTCCVSAMSVVVGAFIPMR